MKIHIWPRQNQNITILEYTTMLDIIEENNICYGAVIQKADGTLETISADITVRKTEDYLYEKISFDSSKRCMTVGTDSEIKMSFPNQRRSEKEPVARKAFVLALKNGQPIGAWDGENIGSLVLGEEDLNVTLPLTIVKKTGDYAHLSFVLFDGEDDMGTFVTERLFYFR